MYKEHRSQIYINSFLSMTFGIFIFLFIVVVILLTMFIKRSVVSKRVEGGSYSILDPAETMAILNDSLVDQALPNCQFVTACYGVINHRTLMLQHARAGHPYPILMPLDGTCSELKSTGALLGLFKDEVFETTQTQLEPGDKLFLYTDGVTEATNADDEEFGEERLARLLVSCSGGTAMDIAAAVLEGIRSHSGSGATQHDDITLLVLRSRPVV